MVQTTVVRKQTKRANEVRREEAGLTSVQYSVPGRVRGTGRKLEEN